MDSEVASALFLNVSNYSLSTNDSKSTEIPSDNNLFEIGSSLFYVTIGTSGGFLILIAIALILVSVLCCWVRNRRTVPETAIHYRLELQVPGTAVV